MWYLHGRRSWIFEVSPAMNTLILKLWMFKEPIRPMHFRYFWPQNLPEKFTYSSLQWFRCGWGGAADPGDGPSLAYYLLTFSSFNSRQISIKGAPAAAKETKEKHAPFNNLLDFRLKTQRWRWHVHVEVKWREKFFRNFWKQILKSWGMN